MMTTPLKILIDVIYISIASLSRNNFGGKLLFRGRIKEPNGIAYMDMHE
ncbi:hypothetical protein HMPREF3033_01353 [Veillonellaceae bacterium DNF00751]|jgi:hypothetical protein|nr:hypothetical protein HMPREF3033_01353 [Veillonellaceae bacterium DNF00751]